MPGPRRSSFFQSIAAAATTATAAVGTLVAEVPRAILRVAWVVHGLRGQNGGEGEKRGESNKGERFHARFPSGGAKIAVGFRLTEKARSGDIARIVCVYVFGDAKFLGKHERKRMAIAIAGQSSLRFLSSPAAHYAPCAFVLMMSGAVSCRATRPNF